MLGRISKQLVDRLEPGSLVWDTSLVGFGVRRQLRHPYYVLRYRLNGKQKLVTIGRHGAWTPETARRKAQELLGVVATGVDPAQSKSDSGSDLFGTVVERYLGRQAAKLKPRTLVEVSRHLRKHSQALHGLALADITRREIATVLAEIEVRSGPVARNRVRANLSALWSWAISEGLTETNVVTGTAKADENGSRERVLSSAEIRALWGALGQDDFSQAIRMLLLTGARRTEIGDLAWSEIDLKSGLLTLPASRVKNGREHTLPLPRQALAILNNRAEVSNGRVWAFRHWALPKARLDAKAQIGEWHIHDLRRTAATHMAELGVMPHVIECVLNHVSGSRGGVAGIYNRSKLFEPMRDALQAWADRIDQITS